MTDRNVLKARMTRLDDSAEVWEIIEGYLDEEYNNMTMFNRLMDHYEGDQKSANAVAWEISDWENEED